MSLRCSPGIMPIFALGHIVPALGAIHSATGSYQCPIAVLGMVGLTIGLVDAYDSFKDVPVPERPRNWSYKIWIASLAFAWLLCVFYSGIQTVIRTQVFLIVGLSWKVPCIPMVSRSKGVYLATPKATLREAKSLFVAVCMGFFTADAVMFHFCHSPDATCSQESLRTKSLGLAILYHFFRETANDMRDIAEDTHNSMKTLPVRLGKTNTITLMTVLGLISDLFLTGAMVSTSSGLRLNPSLAMESAMRVGLTMGAYWKVLNYPRENGWAWGAMALLGLTPVLWAQSSLLSSSKQGFGGIPVHL